MKICQVPGCTRPGFWEEVCTMHWKQAEAAFGLKVLAEVGRELKLELALPGTAEPAEGRKIKISAVPLAWRGTSGTPYGRRVLSSQVERVGLAEPGIRNQILNRAAYVIGGYIAGGEVERERAVEALLRAAEIAGLPLREAASTIRSGVRKGMLKPITAPR